MAACEVCWSEAYARARMLGGSQVEHYQALLAESGGGVPHAPAAVQSEVSTPSEPRSDT